MKIACTLLLSLTLFISCSDSDENVPSETVAEVTARNEAEILDYIEANDLIAEKTSTGLYFVNKTEGTGDLPAPNDDVTVMYKAYFLDGRVFDQSITEASFNAGNLIPGFTQGLTKMKEGGEATFIIPSRLGYGSYGAPPRIPGNTVIIFDVKLISID